MAIGLTYGLIVGLTYGLIFGLSYELGPFFATTSSGLDYGLRVWSGVAVTVARAGLAAGVVGQIEVAERLSWSWAGARARLPRVLIVGLILGLLGGLIPALSAGLEGDLKDILPFLAVGLFLGCSSD